MGGDCMLGQSETLGRCARLELCFFLACLHCRGRACTVQPPAEVGLSEKAATTLALSSCAEPVAPSPGPCSSNTVALSLGAYMGTTLSPVGFLPWPDLGALGPRVGGVSSCELPTEPIQLLDL